MKKFHAQICNPQAIKILSLLAGVVFLFSGIGKSLAAHEFVQLLEQYGGEHLQFLAPFIIVLEVSLGFLLAFRFRLKQASLAALCLVAAMSAVYGYGYLFADIASCGCFGYFSFLNLPPTFTFIRNGALAGALLYIFLRSNSACKAPDEKEFAAALCILCAVSFATGYTYTERRSDATQYVTSGEYAGRSLNNSIFEELLTLSKDSTYLIFAFSYSCPHCLNSIANLKEYERLGMADRVIALSFAADSAPVQKFRRLFCPTFEVKSYPPRQLFRLTNDFPTSYYIKNDTVRLEIHGMLPCGYVLQKQLEKMQKKHRK
jgi:uncharacterized membrane protein YphA (DoxX/SURF4 family)